MYSLCRLSTSTARTKTGKGAGEGVESYVSEINWAGFSLSYVGENELSKSTLETTSPLRLDAMTQWLLKYV